jgi:hypothetical protein
MNRIALPLVIARRRNARRRGAGPAGKNPNCAHSQHYNCPYATDHLAVAIEAGEKAPPPH